MKHLYTFLFCFIVIFILYLLVIYLRKKGVEAFKKGKQLAYFKNVYNIKIDDNNIKKFILALSFTNAFIIAFVVTVIELLDGLFFKLIIGFIMLLPLIIICYDILAKSFGGIRKKKKGDKREKNNISRRK